MESSFRYLLNFERNVDRKKFKKLFGQLSESFGFKKISNCWFLESSDSIIKMDLQKSNFSNLYYLNLGVFIKGAFNKEWTISKELLNAWTFTSSRLPSEYDKFIDFDNEFTEDERILGIKSIFSIYLEEFVKDALTYEGIKKLALDGKITSVDTIISELNSLIEIKINKSNKLEDV